MTNPIVTIEMEDGGEIQIELYAETAPNTVRNFVSLVSKGFYNGTTFHRVIPGFRAAIRKETAWAARATPLQVSSQ